jgi:hypothetical protein
VLDLAGTVERAHRHHHRGHLVGALAEQSRRAQHPVPQTGQAVQGVGERLVEAGGCQHVLGSGVQQRGLVGEDPEDRALRDAGRLGDLLGGQRRPVLEQQRHRDVEDRPAPVVGSHRGRAAGTGGVDRGHVPTIGE